MTTEASQIQSKIRQAGRKALAFKREGFHCSESVFMAINETLEITDPSMVKIVTGFHGGGGTHRMDPSIDLTMALERVASGNDQRPRDELPYEQVGHLCGALASGIVCFGLLHGRSSPSDDLTCVDELSFELHRRFNDEFGENECLALRQKYVDSGQYDTSAFAYKKGAELAVELILRADEQFPECPAQGNSD